ncbi:MAG: hypothetical protein ACI4TX_03945, partial [Christensenellales bacterium]
SNFISTDITDTSENTLIINPTKTLTEYTANENIYIIAGKLQNYTAYHSTTSGQVSALGGLYKQTIANEKYKNNAEFYIQTKSTSAFVKVGKQTYINANQIVMRDATNVQSDIWSNTFTNLSTIEYKTKYGVDAKAMTNYKLNDETIINAQMTKQNDNTYILKCNIDTEKGTIGYKLNMMQMGGLNDLPQFISCTLEITINENWQPLTIKCTDTYKISMLGGLTCTSTLTETFDSINATNLTIPNKDLFASYLQVA